MYRIGSSSKWQVANNKIRESPASIRDSDVCFKKMPRHINDRGCLRFCGAGVRGRARPLSE
jgi:hypothetical protein